MDTILVTGGAGFIGSNFVNQLIQNKNYKIVVLDALTYAGNTENIVNLEEVEFVHGSICNDTQLEKLFLNYNFKKIIHFAAESHVDNSIEGPGKFVQTNINGTFKLLEFARKFWMEDNFEYKENFENSLFLHISTDEVYGTLDLGGKPFNESSPYKPNSPYSSSKASADLLVRSYNKTYGLNTIITNCSNNYGPRQHREKLIPKVIECCLNKTPIPVYGAGANVRDWIDVKIHCEALLLLMESDKYGESFCIGSKNEFKNIDLVKTICEIFNEKEHDFDHKSLITFVQDRPGHDLRYAIDSSKIEKEFNLNLSTDFKKSLRDTVEWYLNNYSTSI